MRGSKRPWAILLLAIVVLLVYAYVDGGLSEQRWIEEELPVQAPEGTVGG